MSSAKFKFKFYSQRSIRADHADLTTWQFARIRSKTQKGVVWQQLEKGGVVMWNWTVLQSILAHGLESPITASLVEEYIASLPTAA
jgi:hypothetical protein